MRVLFCSVLLCTVVTLNFDGCSMRDEYDSLGYASCGVGCLSCGVIPMSGGGVSRAGCLSGVFDSRKILGGDVDFAARCSCLFVFLVNFLACRFGDA